MGLTNKSNNKAIKQNMTSQTAGADIGCNTQQGF